MTKTKRNTLDDVDLKPLEVYTLFDSVLPTDTGIYAIVNKLDGRFYIGSARASGRWPSQQGFRARFNDSSGHRGQLKNGNHHCKFLQNAYNSILKERLHLNEVFEIWVVEYIRFDKCIEVEDWYLKYYRPTYNGVLVAGGGVHDGEYTPSAETRNKLAIASAGREWKPESRLKLAEALAGSFVGINPLGEIIEFKNASEFARQNDLHHGAIIACSLGKVTHHLKWLFFRADDERLNQDFLDNEYKKFHERYIGISPYGLVYRFPVIQEFARAHKLNGGVISDVFGGRVKKHKGWIFLNNSDQSITEDYIESIVEKQKSDLIPKYIGYSPYSEIYTFSDVQNFAKEHGLNGSTIHGCIKGNHKHHKKWYFFVYDPTLLDIKVIQEKVNEINKYFNYIAVSPCGEVVEFSSIADFAREYGLSDSNIQGCIKGRRPHTKQWKFYYAFEYYENVA